MNGGSRAPIGQVSTDLRFAIRDGKLLSLARWRRREAAPEKVACPQCGVLVDPRGLPGHIRAVHERGRPT